MATNIIEKALPNTVDAEVRPQVQDTKVHIGPVSRLLSKVSKWHDENVDYQMEAGMWRKLAI